MSEPEDESPQRDEELEIPEAQVRHPETMYDRSDLSARGIVYFLITLALTIFVIHLVMWAFLRYASGNQLKSVPRTAAIVTPSSQAGKRGDPAVRFPAPQLQPNPVADLNKYRTAVEQQLNSSGAGHIPIEQTIQTLASQGLPVRPKPVLPPRARFASGDDTPAGAAGGTEPAGNK